MGRKRREKPMEAVAEPKTWFVRLDLSTEVHRLLRIAAAEENMSMAAFARREMERLLKERAKRKGGRS
jgi:predicted HicB family RNase H-like nuclease